MTDYVRTTPDNFNLAISDVAKTYGYDVDGNLTTITTTVGGNTYVKTLSWVLGNLTGASGWVKQ